jgi:threonine/homoserine/homoserine lactone efflux protein
MYIEINHLIALGVFSLLGWFALIWFAAEMIRARQAARRAEAHYLKRFAQADAVVDGLVASSSARNSGVETYRYVPGDKA